MLPIRYALPRPPKAEAAALAALAAGDDHDATLNTMLRQHRKLATNLGVLKAQIEKFKFETLCGGKNDAQHVEHYDGSLGVSRKFVDDHEPPVGQLQWLDDLDQRFAGPGEEPGEVAGRRWTSGGLISDDLFLTAGHSFRPDGGGFASPSRKGVAIDRKEIATLMRVNFNFQVDGSTKETVRAGVSYPIEELVENPPGLDFAIVRLGRGTDGRLPGERFGYLRLARRDIQKKSALLCIIQHQGGGPKRIETGPLLENRAGQISYTDLDTAGLSSGALILSAPAGLVVGVHTHGGCTSDGGFNYGVSISAIRAATDLI
jgi:Trypsin-like peptidase domain